jgi:hypothetical protein
MGERTLPAYPLRSQCIGRWYLLRICLGFAQIMYRFRVQRVSTPAHKCWVGLTKNLTLIVRHCCPVKSGVAAFTGMISNAVLAI